MNADIDFKFITQIYGYLLYLPNWNPEYRDEGCDEAINLSGISYWRMKIDVVRYGVDGTRRVVMVWVAID